jgi:hypothetical protein
MGESKHFKKVPVIRKKLILFSSSAMHVKGRLKDLKKMSGYI